MLRSSCDWIATEVMWDQPLCIAFVFVDMCTVKEMLVSVNLLIDQLIDQLWDQITIRS